MPTPDPALRFTLYETAFDVAGRERGTRIVRGACFCGAPLCIEADPFASEDVLQWTLSHDELGLVCFTFPLHLFFDLQWRQERRLSARFALIEEVLVRWHTDVEPFPLGTAPPKETL